MATCIKYLVQIQYYTLRSDTAQCQLTVSESNGGVFVIFTIYHILNLVIRMIHELNLTLKVKLSQRGIVRYFS